MVDKLLDENPERKGGDMTHVWVISFYVMH